MIGKAPLARAGLSFCRRIVPERIIKCCRLARREDRMEDADCFRQKAEQCRRLASGLLNDKDPAVAALLALAVEFEAKAVALTAEQASERQVEQIDPKPE
jgi:hypothetical protein